MKVFLDDCRKCPDGYVLAKTAYEAIYLLLSREVTDISFDHDLGTEEYMLAKNGYDVAKWIEFAVHIGWIRCPKWSVHSANPVGKSNIERCMVSAERTRNE